MGFGEKISDRWCTGACGLPFDLSHQKLKSWVFHREYPERLKSKDCRRDEGAKLVTMRDMRSLSGLIAVLVCP